MKEMNLSIFMELINDGRSFVAGGYFYVPAKVDENILIYANYVYDSSIPDIDDKLKLAGLIDQYGIMHIVDGNMLRFDEADVKASDAVRIFSAKDIADEADYVLSALVDGLETDGAVLNECQSDADDIAWKYALQDKDVSFEPRVDITDEDYFKILLGFKTVKNVVNSYFDENRKELLAQKAMFHLADKIRPKYEDNKDVKLYRIVSGVTAKTVTVTFERNGRKSSGKMTLVRMMQMILLRHHYWRYDFLTRTIGDRVFLELFGKDNNDARLYPSDIVMVKYGKTAIYEC